MAQRPVTVSQLNGYIKRILQTDPLLGHVSVMGEISNFKHHSNGHAYFSLKDDSARINCFLPGSVLQGLRYEIGDGLRVTAEGSVNVYEKGGTYSLNIRSVAVEGAGDLAVAFEKLKEKLAADGLFDPEHKKPLPAFPHTVAIITARTGAAIRDMIKIITSKNDFVDVLVYSTLVQGQEAAGQIAHAIGYINEKYPGTDVIIAGRGGGSVEELWAFNEEVVARAIYDSKIPVISAVGHETDVTIADFVADVRAETPTAAADMAVPDMSDIRAALDDRLGELRRRLRARSEYLTLRLKAAGIERNRAVLYARVREHSAYAAHTLANMKRDAEALLTEKKHAADKAFIRLKASDPHRIMASGYSAITGEDGRLIRSVAQLKTGLHVKAVLTDGQADMLVERVHYEE
ncbi:MAG: exodeoxyribonuclease VII large subunit [Clostridiales Family XIII bacterium]|jgi:exodeoxyribonuclease VII large subunit|nr:exodeoxyribonuclease VII large subunit [Clostridiales Family XIII bacterium]